MHTSPRFPARLARPALAALLVLAACDSGGGGKGATAACTPAGDAISQQAVTEYLKLQRDPYPQRFLVAVGTDSALPDAGVQALQDKGPTYFFPADTNNRKKVRAKLDSVGAFNTLLVAWHGKAQDDAQHATVRLSGAFVGGLRDGVKAPMRAMRFACDSAGWHFTKGEEEQHT